MALLKINALEKHFRTPEGNLQNVLNIDSFSLDAEEQMALKGQSGSGKTTFLHLIAGIISPDSGTILLDGHPLHALSESHRDRLRACTIGYIFQTFNLLQGFTCLENVCLGMMFGSGVDKKRRLHYSVKSGSATTCSIGPLNCRSVNSRESPLLVLWPTIPNSCLQTNPRVIWILNWLKTPCS